VVDKEPVVYAVYTEDLLINLAFSRIPMASSSFNTRDVFGRRAGI